MSTPSKLADEIHMAVLSTDADQPYANVAIDQALSPVRECLEGLAVSVLDGQMCWCPDFCEPHTKECLAAQQLWERLKQS